MCKNGMFCMPAKELKIRVAELYFLEGKEIGPTAKQLHNEGLLPSADPRRIRKLINETGKWLLEQHQELERERRSLRVPELENALSAKYPHVIAARIVHSEPVLTRYDYINIRRKCTAAAAEYFDNVCAIAEDQGEEIYVGVGGGPTILEMVSALPERNRPNVYYYAAAMIGRGRMRTTSPIGPETNPNVAWSRSGYKPGHVNYGTVSPYHFPPDRHVRTRISDELELLAEMQPLKEVLNDMSHINMAIASLWSVNQTPEEAALLPSMSNHLSVLEHIGITRQMLSGEGAVGSLSYNLFDKSGQGRKNWSFFLTAGYPNGLDLYRDLVADRRPVIVVTGPRKEDTLRIALDAKLFNVLIADSLTAKNLLDAE